MARSMTVSRRTYQAVVDRLEAVEDDLAFALHAQVPKDRLLPIEAAERIFAGEHPLRVWREHRGLTASELARRADIGRSYIAEIESGRKPGSVAAYRAIARVLGLQVDDLLPDGP